jgi:phage gp45-like
MGIMADPWYGSHCLLIFIGGCAHSAVVYIMNKSYVCGNQKWYETVVTAHFGKQIAKLLFDVRPRVRGRKACI